MSEEETLSIDFKYGFLAGAIRSIRHYLESTAMTDQQKLDSIKGHIEFTYSSEVMPDE